MNKTVIITGSSRGIGASTAICFAKHDYNVVITYKNSKKEAENLKQELEKYNVKILTIKCDLENESEIKNLIDITIKHFKKIDVLVNNAGIAIDTTFEDKTKSNFLKILDVNLVAPFLLSKYASKYMQEGSIINVSSTNGIDTFYPEGLDYDASKAGLISLTKNLSKQLAPHIRVNAVAPGWTNTDMNKDLDQEFKKQEIEKIFLKRFAEPEEIAKVIYFLASEDASYINGEIIRIDGGY